MSKTENSAVLTDLERRITKDIIKALKECSRAGGSVNNVKVQVALPGLLELLAGHLGDDEVVEPSHPKASPTSPEPKERAQPEGESSSIRETAPFGKSVFEPTLGKAFVGSS